MTLVLTCVDWTG